jgi:IS605 OrfB family transposase
MVPHYRTQVETGAAASFPAREGKQSLSQGARTTCQGTREGQGTIGFIYKTACVLVNTYDNIVVEKLNIRGMVRNHPLAKSMSDAGWGILMRVLRAKAERAGRVVVEVNPAGTLQLCAQCGETVPKRLAVRRHACL